MVAADGNLPKGPKGTGLLVVALSHDSGFHKLLRAIIDELGYLCYDLEIHQGTVQQIARLRPAAIAVDIDCGHERLAWAVIRALKEFPATAAIPVIACAAAMWLLDEQRQFLEHNKILTWCEPFDIGQFVETLNVALTSPAGHADVEARPPVTPQT